MEKKISLRRIFHRERWRYGIFFSYDPLLTSLARKVKGSRYSDTFKCWYVDDDEDNLKQILRVFRDHADIDIKEISSASGNSRSNKTPPANEANTTVSARADFQYLIEKDKSDVVSPVQLSPVSARTSGEITYSAMSRERYGPVEFSINEKEGLLIIKFLGLYKKEWIGELRTYGRCHYDNSRREWLLSWKKLTCDSLVDYFATQGVSVNIRKQVVDEALKNKRREKADEIRAKQLGSKALGGMDAMEMYLDENRYSLRTRESYLSAVELFLRYFSPKEPMEITEDEISHFLYNHIIKLGYSSSYQNQMVSAVKIFYMTGGKGRIKPEILGRPRRSQALPKVFSKEEVSNILNAARNIKHKALLWLIYSCGLRRSEVTNIKLTDLDRDRGIIQIRESKGMVDRIVPVSGKVWEKLDEYLMAYNPRYYVFEGQTGGRYSSESVYRVFKSALMRAGIGKEVGVHSLRHSYATHLHENGLDIRYIQELLGHKSTRTTEIYTHVSRRNLVQVRSPIEDLDVR
jgi:integrase/recombinase XerD